MHTDAWFPVGLDADVRSRTVHAATVNGQSVAIWRGDDQTLNVWENRCPHRGMPLSFGFVQGNTIMCLYHGWGFDSAGQCKSIPAHPDLVPPRTICARSYSAATRYGVVWTNLADEPSSGPTDGETGDWVAIRSIFLGRAIEDARRLVAHSPALGGGAVLSDDGSTAVIGDIVGAALLLAFQPIGETRTGIHATARSANGVTGEMRRRLAGRLEDLRNHSEFSRG